MDPRRVSFQSSHFSVYELSPGVFAAIATPGGAAVSNAGIIDLGDRTLVFDTLLTPQAARDLRRAALQITGRDPELVINSHYHNDHVWGNPVFGPHTLILSTAQTLKLMQTDGVAEVKWAWEVSAKRLEEASRGYESAQDKHKRRDSLLWVGYFGGLVDALPSLGSDAYITFEDSLTIHGSSRTVDLMSFSNSHTGSDTILSVPGTGILFMGDLLFVGCHPYMDESDVHALCGTLAYVLDMQATLFVPGHGSLGTAADLRTNMDYVSVCLDAAHSLLTQGDTSPERIARGTPPAPFTTWDLSRFYAANLESLCAKLAASPSAGSLQ